MSNRSFQDQVSDLWRTRPVRLPARGHIAGVCAGIGYRYGVDPVLIRVAFVVSTLFGGTGILLYLAGWLVLARAGDQASPAESLMGRGHSSDSGTRTVVLLVALAIALSTVGPVSMGLGGSGLLSTALMIGGLWLLYQRQPVPPPLPGGSSAPGMVTGYPGTTYPPGQFTVGPQAVYSPYTKLPDSYVPSETPTPAPPEASPADPSTVAAPATSTAPQPQPPTWDPLGVAPFAWDLPEPATTPSLPAAPRSPRSRLTTTVLGLALIAVAAASALAVVSGSGWLTPGRIGAVALGVIGVGLLIGAFLRRGYGLLVVTGPLAGFVVLASLIGPLDFDNSDMGDRTWAPASASAIEPRYSGAFGSFRLDLTAIDLTEDKSIDIDSKFGELVVLVPPNMNVENHCSVHFGEAACLPDGIDGGADGTEGPVLTLNVDGKFGAVEVRRG